MPMHMHLVFLTRLAERNTSLQEPLSRTRAETQTAFDEARGLEAKWAALEREQRELYQVRSPPAPHPWLVTHISFDLSNYRDTLKASS